MEEGASLRPPKLKDSRGIYDYIGERDKTRRWTEKLVNLVIDPQRTNPIDRFFTKQFFWRQKFGIPFHPKMILGWFVVAKNSYKRLEGKIIDIMPSRDLLIKTDKGNMPIPFDDVVLLKKSKP